MMLAEYDVGAVKIPNSQLIKVAERRSNIAGAKFGMSDMTVFLNINLWYLDYLTLFCFVPCPSNVLKYMQNANSILKFKIGA